MNNLNQPEIKTIRNLLEDISSVLSSFTTDEFELDLTKFLLRDEREEIMEELYFHKSKDLFIDEESIPYSLLISYLSKRLKENIRDD